MPSSRARISSSPPRRARSSTTTRSACSPTATAGSARSPRRSRSMLRTGEAAMTLAPAFFYLFAVVTVAAGFMVIAAKNPVHAVLFLILAFFNAAGLFVLLGAEFLAMLLVVVYVGAVAVLFLFVVMMLDVDFAELRQGFARYMPLGGLIAGGLAIEMVVVSTTVATHGAAKLNETPMAQGAGAAVSVTNAEAIGRVLYTNYVYFFQ